MWTTTMALLMVAAAPPQETAEAGKALAADELREAFVELEDAFSEAQQTFYAELVAAYDAREAQAEGEEPVALPDPIEPAWYPRFVALADGGSIDAEVWCIENHAHSGLEGDAAHADKLARYRVVLSEERPGPMLTKLANCLTFDGRAAANDPEARDTAFELLGTIDDMTGSADVLATTLYARGYALLGSYDPQERADALEFYRIAAEDFPDTSIGQRCGGLVFAEENLKIGQKAPDIIGKDHDGNTLKLSDFAGKVTVIDFWGFW